VSDQFIATAPTLDAYWRSIILFGQNSAAYKLNRTGKSRERIR